MRQIFKNGNVFLNNSFSFADVVVDNGIVISISPSVPVSDCDTIVNCKDKYLIPGFADVHVHLREPGFFCKETIATGTKAGASAGYTSVCSMPNLNPPPDSKENLSIQTEIIKNTANINVYPFATLTKGQTGRGDLVNYSELQKYGAVGFSDDGRGVQSAEKMLAIMQEIKKTDGIIAAHCEDESLLNGGYIHDGIYAKKHNHKGICSESEWGQIKRDLALVEKTGCKYHVCHISTAQSVELIRQAKAKGLPVTCETGPHYLLLCDEDLQEDGRFKMNPPLRSKEDRQALIEGICDGTIDVIATDHAPHTAEEKSRGLEKSAMGVVGLETAFPIMYTYFVKKNIITLEKLIELMCINPRKIFKLDCGLQIGKECNMAVLDLDTKYTINPENFYSKGRATPFANMEVFGQNIRTIVNGRTVWEKNLTEN